MSSDMQQALQSLKEAKAASQSGIEASTEAAKNLREAILAGNSTGNVIDDYVFLKQGDFMQEEIQRYQRVNQLLKGKVGTLISVTYSVEVRTRHRFIGGSEYEHRTYYAYAILTGDELVFDCTGKISCALPTQSYVDFGKSNEVVKGPFFEDDVEYDFRYASKDLEFSVNTVSVDEERSIEFLKHFHGLHKEEDLKLLLEQLGRFELTSE